MKDSKDPFLSFAALFLVVASLFTFLQKQESNSLQSIPALVVGTGLIVKGVVARKRRRSKLMKSLLRSKEDFYQ